MPRNVFVLCLPLQTGTVLTSGRVGRHEVPFSILDCSLSGKMFRSALQRLSTGLFVNEVVLRVHWAISQQRCTFHRIYGANHAERDTSFPMLHEGMRFSLQTYQ